MRHFKKFASGVLVIILILIFAALVLNIEVTYRKGVNYKVYTKSIPLYYKVAYFFARDLQYRELTRDILKGERDKKKIVRTLFDWTVRNIKVPTPGGLPVVDDHVINIVIRGYGEPDQRSDVFATLCSYAGVPSFMKIIKRKDGAKLAVCYVRLGNRYYVFDPANKNYFTDRNGAWVDVATLRAYPERLVSYAVNKEKTSDEQYRSFFKHLEQPSRAAITRPELQMFPKRFFYELCKMFARKDDVQRTK
jgi:hypothetical protein